MFRIVTYIVVTFLGRNEVTHTVGSYATDDNFYEMTYWKYLNAREP